MSKFKVGDRVIVGVGNNRVPGKVLAEDLGCYWVLTASGDRVTRHGTTMSPVPPDPADVLAKLERLLSRAHDRVNIERNDDVYVVTAGPAFGKAVGLAAAIMAAPEPEAES